MTEARQRRILWVLVALSVACGSAWSLVPLSTAADRLAEVPLAAAGFSGVEVPLTEAERAVLGRVDHLHRHYVRGGTALYVTMIDGSRDRHAVHDPRYCFRGAGWTVQGEERRPMGAGEATWLRAEKDGEVAEAVFWFAGSGVPHASLPRYLWSTVARRVSFGAFGGKPILVVVQSFSSQPLDWREVQELAEALRLQGAH